MPPRAAPGDVGRLEDALERAGLLGTLRQLQELLDIPEWLDSPLGPVFTQAAVIALAAELTDRGVNQTQATRTAAARLGLRWQTVRSRARRWGS